MFEKAKPGRDAFTFSLGGMAAKSSFVIAPAIADDRINKIRDEHVRRTREARDEKSARLAGKPSPDSTRLCITRTTGTRPNGRVPHLST